MAKDDKAAKAVKIEPFTDEELENAREYVLCSLYLPREFNILREVARRLVATIDQMRVERDVQPKTATHATFKKAAEIIRKKVKSISDWGWDPSGDEESARRDSLRNEANEIVRRAMDDIADALEEAVQ